MKEKELFLQAYEVGDVNIQYGHNTTTTPVTINIQDVNDNVPTFSRKIYYASVPENTTNIPLTFNGSGVHVKDIDQVFSDIPKLNKEINEETFWYDESFLRWNPNRESLNSRLSCAFKNRNGKIDTSSLWEKIPYY